MSIVQWNEDGAAFLGRIYVGRVERVVPEDWDERTRPTPGAADVPNDRRFADDFRAAQRARYEALQATPWTAAVIIDANGGQDALGHFASGEEAKQAFAAEVEKAINTDE
jgi:hypothetical protein